MGFGSFVKSAVSHVAAPVQKAASKAIEKVAPVASKISPAELQAQIIKKVGGTDIMDQFTQGAFSKVSSFNDMGGIYGMGQDLIDGKSISSRASMLKGLAQQGGAGALGAYAPDLSEFGVNTDYMPDTSIFSSLTDLWNSTKAVGAKVVSNPTGNSSSSGYSAGLLKQNNNWMLIPAIGLIAFLIIKKLRG